MYLVNDAWDSLKRNRFVVYLYLGVHVVLMLLVRSAETAVAGLLRAYRIVELFSSRGLPAEDLPLWVPGFRAVEQLAMIFAVSVLQAVVFARLGKEIDRPLWKCAGDREAVKRFFLLWFLLNLVLAAIDQLCTLALLAQTIDLALFFEFLLFLGYVTYIPVGVCIMYWGRLAWREAPEALAPIRGQARLTLTVCLILCGQYMLYLASARIMATLTTPLEKIMIPAVVFLPLAFLECLAFAAMWRVCMIHRDTPVSGDIDL